MPPRARRPKGNQVGVGAGPAAAPAAPKKVFTLRGILDNPIEAAEFLGVDETIVIGDKPVENKSFAAIKRILAAATDSQKATALLKFALTTNRDVGQINKLEAMLRAETPSLEGAINANKTFDVLNEAIKNRASFLMLRKLVKEYEINPAEAPSGKRNAIFTAISSSNFAATKFFFDNNYADFLKEYEAAFLELAKTINPKNQEKFQNLLLYAATNLDKERSGKLLQQLEATILPNAQYIKAAVAAVKKTIEEAQATGFAARFNEGVDLPARTPEGVATSDHLLVEAVVKLVSGKEVRSLTWNMQSKCVSHENSQQRLLKAVTAGEIQAQKDSALQIGLAPLSDDAAREQVVRSKALAQRAQQQTVQLKDLKGGDEPIGYKNSPTNINETPEQYALRRQEQIDYIIETLRKGKADYLNLQEAAGFINTDAGQISQDLLTRLGAIGYAATFSPSAKNLITIYNTQTLEMVGEEPQPHIYKSLDGGKTCSSRSALAMSAKFKFRNGGEQFAVVNYHLNYDNKLPGTDWFMHQGAPIVAEAGKPFTRVGDYRTVLQGLDTRLRTPSVTAMIASGDANRPSTKFHGLPNSQITEEVATNIESKDKSEELAGGKISTNFSAAEESGEPKSYDAVMVFSAGGKASVELSENNYFFQNDRGTQKVSVQPYSKAKGAAPTTAAATLGAPNAAALQPQSGEHSKAGAAQRSRRPAVVKAPPSGLGQGHFAPKALGRPIIVIGPGVEAAAAMTALPLPRAPEDETAEAETMQEESSKEKLVRSLNELLGQGLGEKLKRNNHLENLQNYAVTSKQSGRYDDAFNYLFKKKDSDIVIKIRINKDSKKSMGMSVAKEGRFSNTKLDEAGAETHLADLATAIESLRFLKEGRDDDLESIQASIFEMEPSATPLRRDPAKALSLRSLSGGRGGNGSEGATKA